MSTAFLSATEIARRVKAGEASAVRILDEMMLRIQRFDNELGSLLAIAGDEVRATAIEIERKRKANEPLGPLAGVPIVIKDNIVTKGLATTAGSKILAGWVPPYESTVVERLRKADALIIAKANLDEFGMGSSTEKSAFKKTRNPWNTSHVPGGSSGGSAAAVAAGLAAAALGTDTGGSIRQPAAFCGTVGLKPTYGRVSALGCHRVRVVAGSSRATHSHRR